MFVDSESASLLSKRYSNACSRFSSGLLGVRSAYYLSQLGHQVTVVDRQASPAAETSFANGGQISVSHAEPWANPSAPFKVLQWLGKEDAPLLFRLHADMRQWLWGLQFMRECTPALGLFLSHWERSTRRVG
jgi:D-amino-acid dehydrogenase